MVDETVGRLLSKVSLSNNTICHKIQHMREDLNNQLIEKLKGKEFRLKLDEATDSNKDAHLICYTRFMDGGTIGEDLLFCKSITTESEHTSLLYYCSSRRPSRGNALSCLLELRQELYLYLKEEEHECAKNFLDTDLLSKLAHLWDLFEKLNALNLSLQRGNMHILKLAEKVSPFRKKQESLIELSCDKTLKTKFDSKKITEFWISVKKDYPFLNAKAQRILIPFATSYLCEAGFRQLRYKKQVPHENRCGTENEGGGVQSDSKGRCEKIAEARRAPRIKKVWDTLA
ncbi:zinc finger MYM-type protein 6-like [Tachypleus tridentatus]|uniref:zinc finger MYM-type protein 6-like n=1 Tax=Tachypleus tridentatus TaxID=6853 RepID=UPI003FD1AB9B